MFQPDLRPILLSLAACWIVAGCHSLDTPSYFHAGQDGREYNPQTGQYEWPTREPQPHTPSTGHHVRAHNDSESHGPTAPTPGGNDERTYNPVTRQFESPNPF